MASGTYKGTIPTTPAMRRAQLECDDGDPTMVRCPTCRGRGSITVEEAAALEADAARKDDSR